MDKEWIRREILVAPNAELAAVAISQVHEQELAEFRAAESVAMDSTTEAQMQLLQAKEELAQLQAQMAVMAEALGAYQMMRSNDGYTYALDEIDEMVEQALSSAPNLLWYFAWQPPDDGYWGVFVKDIFGERDWCESYAPSQQVNVFVTECSAKEGCLPKDEHGQNSEQPQKREGETWSEYRNRMFPNMYAEGHRRIGPDGEDLDSE